MRATEAEPETTIQVKVAESGGDTGKPLRRGKRGYRERAGLTEGAQWSQDPHTRNSSLFLPRNWEMVQSVRL